MILLFKSSIYISFLCILQCFKPYSPCRERQMFHYYCNPPVKSRFKQAIFCKTYKCGSSWLASNCASASINSTYEFLTVFLSQSELLRRHLRTLLNTDTQPYLLSIRDMILEVYITCRCWLILISPLSRKHKKVSRTS